MRQPAKPFTSAELRDAYYHGRELAIGEIVRLLDLWEAVEQYVATGDEDSRRAVLDKATSLARMYPE